MARDPEKSDQETIT